jgi:hypothetical protein
MAFRFRCLVVVSIPRLVVVSITAYYIKRISKGWVFRQFPDAWQALLEKPDGTVECLKTYSSKPSLKEVATLVREESFKR